MRIFRRRSKQPSAPQHKHDQKLVYRFTDLNNHHYFQHGDDTAMCIERMSRLQEYFIWITRGMSDKQYEELIDAALAAHEEHIATKKNPGKTAAILHELKKKKTQVAPINVYYNYLATCYIRQDEKPDELSDQIHEEKIQAFQKAVKKSDSFFFHLPELKELCKYTYFTHEKWQEFTRLSRLVEENHNQTVQYFSQTRPYVNTAKANESS